jgi:hypothetical protein
MSLELDEAADGRRGPLPHGDTGAMWRARNARGLKALNADHDPVAALALLANLDKSGHQRARDRMLQDRVPKAECLQRGDGKSGRHRGQGDRHRKGDRAPPRQIGHQDHDNSQRQGGPPRWLSVCTEVADDA